MRRSVKQISKKHCKKSNLRPFVLRKPPDVTGNDIQLRKLQVECFNITQQTLKYQLAVIHWGSWGWWDTDPALPMGQMLVQAYLDLEPTHVERLAILTEYVGLTRKFEGILKKRFDIDTIPKSYYLVAKYTRLDAEIHLAKEKEGKK